MGTNIYIQSDFIEPYDKYLHDPMGKIRWKRLSKGGRNRREIFKLLYQYVKGFCDSYSHVVPNGVVEELYDRYDDNYEGTLRGEKWNFNWDHTGIQTPFSELVIYTDEMAHRGEGKIVVDVEDAMEKYPNHYASVFLRSDQRYFTSHRDLYIGDYVYKLVYQSITDDWRSNCGYVTIIYEGKYNANATISGKLGIKSPIFAFDYIDSQVESSQHPEGCPNQFYLDFNEAPGIPEEVVINEFNNERKGELVSFYEIISAEKISKIIENKLKSDNK